MQCEIEINQLRKDSWKYNKNLILLLTQHACFLFYWKNDSGDYGYRGCVSFHELQFVITNPLPKKKRKETTRTTWNKKYEV